MPRADVDFESKYNTKVPAVKRLMREASELKEPTEDYCAHPLEDNLFEWHFTVKGASTTEFEGGFYHGRIILPSEYPMKPPNIILLTPNGRFEINKKICLSISGYHPETWQPSWSIRTALLALIAFMPTHGEGTIGSLDYTPEERKVLARKSRVWKCTQCGLISSLLGRSAAEVSQAESKLIQSVVFKAEDAPRQKDSSDATSPKQESSAPNCESTATAQVISERPLENSGFGIGRTTSDILITLIVLVIAFLVYRRLYLM